MFNFIIRHVKTVAIKSKQAYTEGRYALNSEMIEALDVLGLPYHSDMKQIKKRYFELSQELHPDTAKVMDNEHFLRVKEAYNVLKVAFR